MRILVIGIAAVAVIAVIALGGMIAFGTTDPPPPLASISAPFRNVDFGDLPPIDRISGRDHYSLAYRLYPAAANNGEPERVVIAIHGSSANSASLHSLAKALQAGGIATYVPDIRGHGRTGQRGDIERPSALDDDLADLVATVRAKHPQSKLVLIGFSSGGGFALHAIATPTGASFERAVLISPMLGVRAPTAKTTSDGWAKPYLPRIIALLILNRIGIHAFDHLPALAFGIAAGNPADLTGVYSFGLMRAFGTRDYAADLRNARAPIAIVVGGGDELFEANLFAPTVHAIRADVPVTIVPELGHIAMTTEARAVPAILAAIRGAP